MKSLEKLILKYRTNEMMRLMFHIEDLRKYLIHSMKASNLFLEESDERFFNDSDKVMRQVWKRVAADGLLTKSEIDDLKKIIDKRNTIAHEIHSFTRDLKLEFKDYLKDRHFKSKYDYMALERLLTYKNKIQSQWKDIEVLSLRSIHFEFADNTYKNENNKLSKTIDKLYVQREQLINRVTQELNQVKFDEYTELARNESNFLANGNLSPQGSKVCRDLILQGLSTYAVSILMDISLSKVNYQKRKIEKRT
ncbi:hypothetical protein HJZ14_23500 [Vibrio parahaemolyticus]|nr:hypothetical protein [Vibrio parahaemolyticus]MBE4494613.1 hypothetical protein [Vibrio parahaemolyticus]MBE4503510.1 hypothetical protein [Vibrio parahaemolyticus]MBE4508116.1 hypothetical protein [Vibrio parahaemolyticus]